MLITDIVKRNVENGLVLNRQGKWVTIEQAIKEEDIYSKEINQHLQSESDAGIIQNPSLTETATINDISLESKRERPVQNPDEEFRMQDTAIIDIQEIRDIQSSPDKPALNSSLNNPENNFLSMAGDSDTPVNDRQDTVSFDKDIGIQSTAHEDILNPKIVGGIPEPSDVWDKERKRHRLLIIALFSSSALIIAGISLLVLFFR